MVRNSSANGSGKWTVRSDISFGNDKRYTSFGKWLLSYDSILEYMYYIINNKNKILNKRNPKCLKPFRRNQINFSNSSTNSVVIRVIA